MNSYIDHRMLAKLLMVNISKNVLSLSGSIIRQLCAGIGIELMAYNYMLYSWTYLNACSQIGCIDGNYWYIRPDGGWSDVSQLDSVYVFDAKNVYMLVLSMRIGCASADLGFWLEPNWSTVIKDLIKLFEYDVAITQMMHRNYCLISAWNRAIFSTENVFEIEFTGLSTILLNIFFKIPQTLLKYSIMCE